MDCLEPRAIAWSGYWETLSLQCPCRRLTVNILTYYQKMGLSRNSIWNASIWSSEIRSPTQLRSIFFSSSRDSEGAKLSDTYSMHEDTLCFSLAATTYAGFCSAFWVNLVLSSILGNASKHDNHSYQYAFLPVHHPSYHVHSGVASMSFQMISAV
jgi:hypothetical protein